MLRRFLAQLVFRVPHYPFALASFIVSSLRLAARYPQLKSAGVVAVLDEGGFGHTISGPEATRRFYVGQNPVLIVISDRAFHNPAVAELWPDVTVIFFRMIWRVRVFGRSYHLGGVTLRTRQLVGSFLRKTIGSCTSASLVSLQDVYDAIEATLPVMPKETTPSNRWIPGWWRLVKARDAAVHLPTQIGERIRLKLSQFVGGKETGRPLCCLYLRCKDFSGRMGSPFEAYLPAIRYLTDKGYVVLVTGDREPGREYIQEFDRKMVCASFLGIDPWYFDLFAATEARIWIGDTGGGSWLSITNRIPMLVLNGFPFGFAVPGASMQYKLVMDGTGKPVHYSKLFRNHPFDLDLKGLFLKENTAEQINGAVKVFIAEIEGAPVAERGRLAMESFPDNVLGKHVDTRLSENYLRIFDAIESDMETQLSLENVQQRKA